MKNIHDLLSGKMYREHSVQIEAKIFDRSLKHLSKSSNRKPRCLRLIKTNGLIPTSSWETDGVWLIELSIRNTSTHPNGAKESTLSQILEANVPGKYYLSLKACQGILYRSLQRGKELPKILRIALEQCLHSSQEQLQD